MAIVMPTVVDDNGTGTTGTILDLAKWTALGTAIDTAIAAAIAATPTTAAFTPSDGSGAGLTFTGVSGLYVKQGRIVSVALQVTWPSTANGAQAKIAGLPFAPSAYSGFMVSYCDAGTLPTILSFPTALTVVSLNTVGMAAVTNATMSLKTLAINATYVTP